MSVKPSYDGPDNEPAQGAAATTTENKTISGLAFIAAILLLFFPRSTDEGARAEADESVPS